MGLDDPGNAYDAPVPGFVGPGGIGQSTASNNFVNPVFVSWADAVDAYVPAPGVAETWTDTSRALGQVTGHNMDIVSLGDLDATQIANGEAPGFITLTFARPIRNYTGADFVVFENSSISAGGAGVAGQVFAELAYVEVSSNGTDFARFPTHSLTPEPVGAYGTIDPTDVHNLAGKHVNAYGDSWGTPFFLEDLEAHPQVLDGTINLDAITHVRIVDIPGDGSFTDSHGNPIYDAWLTFGSGGFDLEAVGVISTSMTYAEWIALSEVTGDAALPKADPSGNGVPNLLEYASGGHPTRVSFKPGIHELSIHEDDADAYLTLHFVRDERVTDLLYEVQASADLKDWETIAQSAAGDPLASDHDIRIVETAASAIDSIGVLRQVAVSDIVPLSSVNTRFLRLKVSFLDDE